MAGRKLTALETIALCRALKDKDAVGAIKEGQTKTVDFTVRVSGQVARGFGVPAGETSAPPAVDLTCPEVLFEVLRRCGIGPRRVQSQLQGLIDELIAGGATSVGSHSFEGSKIAPVVESITAATVGRLPEGTKATNGRKGAVTVNATVEVVA